MRILGAVDTGFIGAHVMGHLLDESCILGSVREYALNVVCVPHLRSNTLLSLAPLLA